MDPCLSAIIVAWLMMRVVIVVVYRIEYLSRIWIFMWQHSIAPCFRIIMDFR